MKSLKVGIYFEDVDGNIVHKEPLNSNWRLICDPESKEMKVTDLIIEIITEQVKNGFDRELVRRALNGIMGD